MAVVTANVDSSNSEPPLDSASAAARVQADFPDLARFIPDREGGKAAVHDLSKDDALQAIGDLIKNLGMIEPGISFVIFAQICLSVDKKIIGGPNDPTRTLMQISADEAPPAFWKAAKDASNDTSLGQFLSRCRSLISVFSRHKNFEPIVSVLQVLTRINLNEELVAKYKLLDVLETVASQSENADANALAKRLVNKFHKLSSNTNSSSSTPATPKLFGSSGALKLRTGKRSREPEDNQEPISENTPVEHSSTEHEPAVSNLELDTPIDTPQHTDDGGEPDDTNKPRKKAKTNKRVHWKPDSKLVEVRFYEMDGEAKFKSRSARFQEVEEANQFVPPLIEWSAPKPIDFSSLPSQFRGMMSIRRGGELNPSSPEAEAQTQRESRVPRAVYADFLGTPIPDSPKEPSNPADLGPESSWVPKEGGKFVPAKPSASWLEKHGEKQNQTPAVPTPTMPNPMAPGMNPMMGMGMNGGIPPMMHGFGWGMNPMMGMMPPPQMNELYKMNSMFGKPNQG